MERNYQFIGFLITIVIVLAGIVYIIETNPSPVNLGYLPGTIINENEIKGKLIAQELNEKYNNISYIWLYNNTFCNSNLTSQFGMYIDGLRVAKKENTMEMALIYEPNISVTTVDNQNLSTSMGKFVSVFESVTQLSNSTLTAVFPPTILIDIAYEDGTSISIVYSKERKIYGAIDGAWTLSESTHHGLHSVQFFYSSTKFTFFMLTDHLVTSANNAIAGFKDLIVSSFSLT